MSGDVGSKDCINTIRIGNGIMAMKNPVKKQNHIYASINDVVFKVYTYAKPRHEDYEVRKTKESDCRKQVLGICYR